MGNFLFIFEFISALLLLSWILQKWVDSIWWKPLMLERCLKKQGIMGPSYVFLSGNLEDNARFMKEARSKPMDLSHKIVPRVAPFLHETVNKYGKMSVIWFGTKPRVSIMDPQLIKEVLSNKFGHFEKPKTNPFFRLLVTGLANYDGEKWAKHRRIINPAFHLEKIKRMLPAFSTSCIEMISRWENLASGEGSYELDVWPQLQNLTGDVISRTAFGSNYKEGDRIFKLQTEQAELVMQAFMSVYIYIPGFRFLPTKKNLRRNEINREVHSLLTAIIKKREKAIRLGEAPTDDLLGLLMESSSKDSQEYGNAEGLTIEDVIEECKLFYFAGQETTSVLLTWTMVVLSMNPKWQTRARDEVLQIFGRNTPDFDGLNHLKIVTMILYEVLRLYPPVINLVRSTYKEMTLGGVTFPPGVQLSLPTLLVHHDPELWGEDAEEFNPERFSGGISKATNSQVAFFPFGWGPRICIGQSFALSEAKIILAMILQKFWFALSPSYVHAPYTVVTLQPQYGAQIILHTLADGTR